MLTTEEVETLQLLLKKVKDHGIAISKGLAELHDTHPYSQNCHNYFKLGHDETLRLKYDDFHNNFDLEDMMNGFLIEFDDLNKSVEERVNEMKSQYDYFYEEDLKNRQKESEYKRKTFSQNIKLYLQEFPDLKSEFQ